MHGLFMPEKIIDTVGNILYLKVIDGKVSFHKYCIKQLNWYWFVYSHSSLFITEIK